MKKILALVLPLAAAPSWAGPAQQVLYPAGPQAGHILDLWRLTMVVTCGVFAAVLAAFLYAIWRAPHTREPAPPDLAPLTEPEPRVKRNIVLAVALSTVLLIVLIVADFVTDRRLSRLPLQDALHLEVTGHMWWWGVHYGDPEPTREFDTANEIVIPAGRPVILTLRSGDVIHSFWVPNLHGKKDLIPGRTALFRLRADKPGLYRGQCAEFCGLEHALMSFQVRAVPPADYEAWAARQRLGAPEPVTALQKQGRDVFLQRSCAMCHSIGGTTAGAHSGPDLTHVASRSTLASGALPNTAQHLAGWILDPQKFKPGSKMPATSLAPAELTALLAYLGTLK